MEIRCEEVRRLLAAYLKQQLGFPEKGQIERHLFYCPDCISHLAMVRAQNPHTEEPASV